jgi:hypothetical protein
MQLPKPQPRVRRLLKLCESRGVYPRGLPRGPLDALRRDPVSVLAAAGLAPDPWQADLLRSAAARLLLLCARQSGKSTVAAALALRTALVQPRALVLLLSPSLRQSVELFRKVVQLFQNLGRPVPLAARSAFRLELANGARIIGLPSAEETIRGYSEVALAVLDEAARVSDPLYYAVRPMLAVSRGRLIALSTPFGQRGWFHAEWAGPADWQRVMITADQCPRIAPEFLIEERQALGKRWYRQEYECNFEETTDAVFAHADIAAALRDDLRPLFAGPRG